jgi:hypothetical protein
MKLLTTYLFDFKHQPREIKWFKNALSLFILYKVCVYIYLFPELFSECRFIYPSIKHVNLFIDSAFFLSNNYSLLLAICMISAIGLFSVLEIINKSNYFIRFLLWLIILNLTNFLYPTLTGGDYLLNQLLLFNIFLTNKSFKNSIINELSNVIHNLALIGIKIQICLVYFLAAWFKLTDASWLNGSAIYNIFQIPEYSNTLFYSLPKWFCAISTYVVLVYQLSFCILVWIKPMKKYILALGIFQHLVIAFGMGLFSFGIIMIVCYILFLNYDYKSQKNLA